MIDVGVLFVVKVVVQALLAALLKLAMAFMVLLVLVNTPLLVLLVVVKAPLLLMLATKAPPDDTGNMAVVAFPAALKCPAVVKLRPPTLEFKVATLALKLPPAEQTTPCCCFMC